MPLDEGIVNSLPEDIRNEPSFAEIQKSDLPGVFKNLIDSQKTLGRAIILPDEKADEKTRAEKLNSVYEKLGRPKSHEEYDFKEVIGENKIDPARLEKYQKVFHEAGLSNSQGARLLQVALEEASSAFNVEDTIKALATGDEKHKGWGEKVEEMIGLAKLPLSKFDTDGEVTAFLEETGLGNHPAIIRFLHNIGTQLKGDSVPPRIENRGGTLDKAGAQSKLAAIMSDKKHAYWDRSNPGYRQAQEEVANLNKVIFGEDVVGELGTH
jgi:hypothetical protein